MYKNIKTLMWESVCPDSPKCSEKLSSQFPYERAQSVPDATDELSVKSKRLSDQIWTFIARA